MVVFKSKMGNVPDSLEHNNTNLNVNNNETPKTPLGNTISNNDPDNLPAIDHNTSKVAVSGIIMPKPRIKIKKNVNNGITGTLIDVDVAKV